MPMIVIFTRDFLRICWHARGVFLALLTLLLAGAVTIAGVENMPLGEAVYFSFITGLTVGYGDIVPNTTIGRIVSVALAFIGIVFSGLVVAIVVRATRNSWEESQKPD
jgi:voltage-gated potassium channel